MKSNYSEPKIYTGGVDLKQWSKLSKTEQKQVLKKDWYVYFSFRNPETGKLKRQSGIKGGANRFHTKKERLDFLKILQRNLSILLQAGFNPYEDNSELIKKFSKTTDSPSLVDAPLASETQMSNNDVGTKVSKVPKIQEERKPIEPLPPKPTGTTVQDAFKLGLKIKKKTLNDNSYPKFKSPILRFEKWLAEKKITHIESVTKKIVLEYLNIVLDRTSPRSRNNTRTSLSSLFTTLENNDIIKENFILKINVLKAIPVRNKTFTPLQIQNLNSYLDENDPLLKLFIEFISYNFLRPIEVCRLKIKDLDVSDKKIAVKAKNKLVKIKIIPDILLDKLPDLSGLDENMDLFTPSKIGGTWDVSATDKRNYFSKRFKKVKELHNLSENYGLYSFRHTHTTILYRELAKSMTPQEAKSRLMLITGHVTLKALDAYLRDIDAVLPEDYSYLYKKGNEL